ncbi:hypothetical protein MKW94_022553, partial [Papaver nudicaule]|nr:hypothetical protein [Papaver nudicaule]
MARFGCFPCAASNKGESTKRGGGSVTHDGVRSAQAESEYDVANARVFTLIELIVATDEFHSERVLGEGKQGRVYMGTLSDGQKVAVKKLKRNTQEGRAEFMVEVKMLSSLKHSNLVKLIGYHEKGSDQFIVYELMPLRSLDLHLHGHEIGSKPLDWKTRMKIAEGVAKALQYLHDQMDPPLLYGGLKTSGILLDEEFNPKLSDFSFAKVGPTWDFTKVSTMVMGIKGYCPPEYGMTGMLTKQYDIYSFGVVLLELITGRMAILETHPSRMRSIVSW